MNNKLIMYVNSLFSGVTMNQSIAELREEMLQNLNEKYNDLISEGKTPDEAYANAVKDVGDISELIRELQGDRMGIYNILGSVDKSEIEFRRKYAILFSISVGLYIISPSMTIFFSVLPINDSFGVIAMFTIIAIATALLIINNNLKKLHVNNFNSDNSSEKIDLNELIRKTESKKAVLMPISIALYILCITPVILLDSVGFKSEFGVGLMFVMIAIATGLIIYANKSGFYAKDNITRINYNVYKKQITDAEEVSVGKSIAKSVLWLTAVPVYFIISFIFNSWPVSWIVFLIAAAINQIINGIFDLVKNK